MTALPIVDRADPADCDPGVDRLYRITPTNRVQPATASQSECLGGVKRTTVIAGSVAQPLNSLSAIRICRLGPPLMSPNI